MVQRVGRGLLEAADYVKEFSGKIGSTIKNLGQSLCPISYCLARRSSVLQNCRRPCERNA
ncbi:MAG: hypothetical protein CMJ64_09095 [Planctomycetaceae bacterium]|nr:hypothetical protein [Planctomycetaceae bacterium]